MAPLTSHCGATSALPTCFSQIPDGFVSQSRETVRASDNEGFYNFRICIVLALLVLMLPFLFGEANLYFFFRNKEECSDIF